MEWVDNLREFKREVVRSAVKAGCRERVFPGLGWVLEQALAMRRREAENGAVREHINGVMESAMAPEAAKAELQKLKEKFGF